MLTWDLRYNTLPDATLPWPSPDNDSTYGVNAVDLTTFASTAFGRLGLAYFYQPVYFSETDIHLVLIWSSCAFTRYGILYTIRCKLFHARLRFEYEIQQTAILHPLAYFSNPASFKKRIFTRDKVVYNPTFLKKTHRG